MSRYYHLLIIDPQNDFADARGSLFVPGADADSKRLASFIKKNARKLSAVSVTLDSHHLFDVAHPMYWVNSSGDNPAPFTIITVDDVENGVWWSVVPQLRQRSLDYVKSLAAGGRYPLCVWPPHCLIGTWGNNVQEDINNALEEMVTGPGPVLGVNYVTKGSNRYVEHYSAVKAEVLDPQDGTTQMNTGLIQVLQQADRVYLSGQALSHCVANTVRDIAAEFGQENVSKLYLIEDTCSNVPTFEKLGEEFVRDLVAMGMNLVKSTDPIV